MTRSLPLVLSVVGLLACVADLAHTQIGARESSALPALGRYAVSRVLGREQTSYHAAGAPAAARLANRQHGLTATFDASGARLSSGPTRLTLELVGIGYGDRLESVDAVEPHAIENRVEFRREALTEWFVNGPFGLQHGFTLERAPRGERSGPLTLRIRLGGELGASVDQDRRGLSLLDDDGATRLRYAGLIAYDADGRDLGARMAVRGRAVELRVDDAGARYPIVVDPFIERAKLLAFDGQPGDEFGISVAISGDTIVVGAQLDDDMGRDVGAAFVFEKPADGWATMTRAAKLLPSGPHYGLGALFGACVAIDGDTIAVGAQRDSASSIGVGAIYVFEKPVGGWTSMTETAKLIARGTTARAPLGYSVAISGDTIVGGTYDAYSGKIHVFVRPGPTWWSMTETATLTNSDNAPYDFFGLSVAISGGTIVAGAPMGTGNVASCGAAYVFAKPQGGWTSMTETAKLTSSDGQAPDRFGQAVSISGDTAVVGAYGAAVAGPGSGAAYVFVKPTGGWSAINESAKLRPSDGVPGGKFGTDVAIHGDSIVVGVTESTVLPTGAAYFFAKPPAGWTSTTETQRILGHDTATGDYFGVSVAVDGDTVVVGAPRDDDVARDSGSAYVFPSTFLVGTGAARIGRSYSYWLSAPVSAGQSYRLASSFPGGSIRLGGRRIGLAPDPLLALSLSNQVPGVFVNHAGTLDGSGNAVAFLRVPNLAGLVGQTIRSAFVTIRPASAGGIFAVSNTTYIQIAP